MKPSSYITYFEAIAANNLDIAHPGSGTVKRFAVINDPPKDNLSGEWTTEFKDAVRGSFDVKTKIGMVLEMYIEKMDEKSPTDIRANKIGSFILLKKPPFVTQAGIQQIWDETRATALQIIGYINEDFRYKVDSGQSYQAPCLELSAVESVAVSRVGDLYGWRVEFEFMGYETLTATYDPQYWQTPLPVFL